MINLIPFGRIQLPFETIKKHIENLALTLKPKVHHGSLYQWIKRILCIKPVKKECLFKSNQDAL
jgi:hypothetical protein